MKLWRNAEYGVNNYCKFCLDYGNGVFAFGSNVPLLLEGRGYRSTKTKGIWGELLVEGETKNDILNELKQKYSEELI